MDLSVDPAQDFYQFANGGWLARTEIPADAASYGVFDALYDKTEAQQFAQLDALMNDNTLEEGSDQWKAVEFYKQGVDMETRNAQGITPLQPQLDAIAGITDLADMHEKMASPAFNGIPDFFNVGLTADPADSTVNTAWLAGPILGLPDVTYYTEDSESNIAAREAYKATAAGFFQLNGMSEADATAAAQAVYDFEASLAAQMVTPVEAQDFAVIYNPTTLDDMQTLYPDLDWQAYLTNAGATVDGSSIVIDSEKRLMENLATTLGETDLQTITELPDPADHDGRGALSRSAGARHLLRLPASALRRAGAAPGRAVCADRGQQPDARGHGPGLRRRVLLARGQGRYRSAGREPDRRLPRPAARTTPG